MIVIKVLFDYLEEEEEEDFILCSSMLYPCTNSDLFNEKTENFKKNVSNKTKVFH